MISISPASKSQETISLLVTGCRIHVSCHHHKDFFITESEGHAKPKAVIFLLLLQTNVVVMANNGHLPNKSQDVYVVLEQCSLVNQHFKDDMPDLTAPLD